MMDSLFAKIDAIAVTATALPEDDQAAVDRLTDQLRERLADLDAAKATLEHLHTDSAWLKEKTQDLLNDLTKTRTEARQAHLERVIDYFNHAHDLGLRVPYQWGEQTEHLEDGQLTPHVVDWVLEQLGGKSFLDIATDKLKAAFQQSAWRVKRSRRHVTLQGFVHVEDSYSGGKKRLSHYAGEKLTVLAKALGRFERDTTNAPAGLAQRFHELCGYWGEPPFGEPIPTFLLKCSEVVVFKNGNVRLAFAGDAEAAAFTTFYELKISD